MSEDVRDEWSDAIDAAFPTRSGEHGAYATAMQMVGNRHSKGALVALTTYLLVEILKLDRARLDRSLPNQIAALESALAEEKKAHEGLRDAMVAAEALREDAEDERDAEEVAHGITKARLHNAMSLHGERSWLIDTMSAEHLAERARTDALVAALPECDDCDAPATHSLESGCCISPTCDTHAEYDDDELSYAAPLRAILAACAEEVGKK